MLERAGFARVANLAGGMLAWKDCGLPVQGKLAKRACPQPTPRLAPPATKGHLSVARLSSYWYFACRSHGARKAPARAHRARHSAGAVPRRRAASPRRCSIAARTATRRCRSAASSASGRLECALSRLAIRRQRRLPADPRPRPRATIAIGAPPRSRVFERDGVVWVYANADTDAGRRAARRSRRPMATGYTTVVREVSADSTLHAMLENALDVPHTAYLHRGLFRGGDKHEITAIVRRSADRVEAEYLGRAAPRGHRRAHALAERRRRRAHRPLHPAVDRPGRVSTGQRKPFPGHFVVHARVGFSHAHAGDRKLQDPTSGTLAQTRARAVRDANLSTRTPGCCASNPTTSGVSAASSSCPPNIDFLGPHIWRLLKQAESGERSQDNERRGRTRSEVSGMSSLRWRPHPEPDRCGTAGRALGDRCAQLRPDRHGCSRSSTPVRIANGAGAPGVLPTLNAALNASAAVCLITGFVFIRKKWVVAHRNCMLLACAISSMFLVTYLMHHAQVGSVPFRGTGALRTLYLSILLPHIVLAAVIVPLALFTIYRGWTGRIAAHRRSRAGRCRSGSMSR